MSAKSGAVDDSEESVIVGLLFQLGRVANRIASALRPRDMGCVVIKAARSASTASARQAKTRPSRARDGVGSRGGVLTYVSRRRRDQRAGLDGA
jgi:hypothetical protein